MEGAEESRGMQDHHGHWALAVVVTIQVRLALLQVLYIARINRIHELAVPRMQQSVMSIAEVQLRN